MKKKPMTKAQARANAADLTLRNLRAAKKRLMNHEARIDALEQAVQALTPPPSAPSEPLGPEEDPAA